MIEIQTPIANESINELYVNQPILITGRVYAGRDAVLPKILELAEAGKLQELGVNLEGAVIFHTAVSAAGIGPTSSNKFEIESTIVPLSQYGVKIHLGKGELSSQTVEGLAKHNSAYAITPPVTALLGERTLSSRLILFPELGMEAFYELDVVDMPAIIAATKGESLYK